MTDEEFDDARKNTYRADCGWYFDENEDGDYVRSNQPDGFCIIRDLFTHCVGKCGDYIKDIQNENNGKDDDANKKM